MISLKIAVILCCFILLQLINCCESVQCDQNGPTEAVNDPNSWYGVLAPMVPEGDEEMRGLLCDLDKVRPLVEEMANAKLDQEQWVDMGQSEDAQFIASNQNFDEFVPNSSADSGKSIFKKTNKGIRRVSTGFKRATVGLAKWPKLTQIYKSLRSGEFYREIAAKNPKMAKIIPLMIECSRGIRTFRNENVPKLMGQMQNLIDQIAKLEGVDLAKVPPMEIGAIKGKNAILTVVKMLMKGLFRGENSENSKETGKEKFWTVFRGWKTVIQNEQFAKLLSQHSGIINANINGHRRKKRMGIALILGIIASAAIILGILFYFFLEKCCKCLF